MIGWTAYQLNSANVFSENMSENFCYGNMKSKYNRYTKHCFRSKFYRSFGIYLDRLTFFLIFNRIYLNYQIEFDTKDCYKYNYVIIYEICVELSIFRCRISTFPMCVQMFFSSQFIFDRIFGIPTEERGKSRKLKTF